MKDYLLLGIDKGLISFNEDKSRIRYNRQKKERNYNNPEEKVQVLAFLQLILDYNYPESRIRQFEPVTMGQCTATKINILHGMFEECNIPASELVFEFRSEQEGEDEE